MSVLSNFRLIRSSPAQEATKESTTALIASRPPSRSYRDAISVTPRVHPLSRFTLWRRGRELEHGGEVQCPSLGPGSLDDRPVSADQLQRPRPDRRLVLAASVADRSNWLRGTVAPRPRPLSKTPGSRRRGSPGPTRSRARTNDSGE